MMASPISTATDQLGPDGIIRVDQKRFGQHAFENLGMHLDARHCRFDRRRLEVEKADRRRADQDEPAAQPVRRHGALQHVFGRNVTRRIVLVEMDPQLTVAVGRHFEARHRHRLHAGLVDAHQDGAGMA